MIQNNIHDRATKFPRTRAKMEILQNPAAFSMLHLFIALYQYLEVVFTSKFCKNAEYDLLFDLFSAFVSRV